VLHFEAIDDEVKWARLGRGPTAGLGGALAWNDWLYMTNSKSADRGSRLQVD
jgi:hypothetical protein